MYRGINGTPPSRAPSCANPTPLNYHRPPPLRPSHSALSLSLSASSFPSVPSFSSSSLPLPYRDSLESLAIFPTPSLSVSLLYVRAHVYLHVFLSCAPRPSSLARRSGPPPSYDSHPATTTFVFACPAHVPDRLPSNPLSGTGVYSRGVRSRYCPDRGMQRLEDARIHT